MKAIDVVLGLLCVATGGFWIFVTVQVFRSTPDARLAYIATFFGLVFVMAGATLLWRRLALRLTELANRCSENRKD